MNTIIETLTTWGEQTLTSIWLPLLIWTGLAILSILLLKLFKQLHPILKTQLYVALLFALPFGILLINNITFPVSFSPTIEQVEFTPIPPVIFDEPLTEDRTSVVAPETESITESPRLPQLTPWFWLGLITLLAGLFAGYRLAVLLNEYVSLLRLKKQLKPFDRAVLAPILERAKKDWEIPLDTIQVLEGEKDWVPMTFGWRKPVIVLPPSLSTNPASLEIVLFHELVHIRRKDYVRRWFERLIDACFAVHPLVRYILKEIQWFRELSCDAEVLAKTPVASHDYATVLWNLSQEQQIAIAPSATGMAILPKHLMKRIQSLKKKSFHFIEEKRADARVLQGMSVLVVLLVMGCFNVTKQPKHWESIYWRLEMQFGDEEPMSNAGIIDEPYVLLHLSSPNATGRAILSPMKFPGAKRVEFDRANRFAVEAENFKVTFQVQHDNPFWYRVDKDYVDPGIRSPLDMLGNQIGFRVSWEAEKKARLQVLNSYKFIESKDSGLYEKELKAVEDNRVFKVQHGTIKVNGHPIVLGTTLFPISKNISGGLEATHYQGYFIYGKGRIVFSPSPFKNAKALVLTNPKQFSVTEGAFTLEVSSEAPLLTEGNTVWYRVDTGALGDVRNEYGEEFIQPLIDRGVVMEEVIFQDHSHNLGNIDYVRQR